MSVNVSVSYFDVLLIEFQSVMDNWCIGCLMGIPAAFKISDLLQTSVEKNKTLAKE